jgi:hypothetical protein
MYTLIGPIVIDRTNTIPNFVIEQIQYLILFRGSRRTTPWYYALYEAIVMTMLEPVT